MSSSRSRRGEARRRRFAVGVALAVSGAVQFGSAVPAGAVAPVLSVMPDQTIASRAGRVFQGPNAPKVTDADSTTLELQIQVTGPTPRPTFDLDGTTGLTVVGNPTSSNLVKVTGSKANINAALDGMTIEGGSNGGTWQFRFSTDDTPGVAGGGADLEIVDVTVTDIAPTIAVPGNQSVGTNATKSLYSTAFDLADADSDTVFLEIDSVGAEPKVHFQVDTTGVLVAEGTGTDSTHVRLQGRPTELEDVLATFAVIGTPETTATSILFTVEDRGPDPNTDTAGFNVAVTDLDPVVVFPVLGSMPTFSSRTLGFGAPAVQDADSPVVQVGLTDTSGADVDISLPDDTGVDVFSACGAPPCGALNFWGPVNAVNEALRRVVITSGNATGAHPITFAVADTPWPTPATYNPASAQRTLTVTDAPPSITDEIDRALQVGQSVQLTGTAAPQVADADSPVLEVSVTTTGGTPGNRPRFSLDGNNGLQVTGGWVNAEGTTFSGSITDINAALDGMRVFSGPATGAFTMTFTVDHNPGAAGGASDTQSFSITVTPAPSPAGVPGPPSGVVATAGPGPTQATVTWSAPATNGGSQITGYRVTPVRAGVAQPPINTSGAGRTVVVDDLDIGVNYRFRVAATNAVGTGADSALSGVVSTADYLPFTSYAAMVNRLFADLVGRAPTTAERNAAVTALTNASLTPGGLAAQLRGGTDNATNVDPVTRLYRAYFLRIPDAGGLEYWIARKRAGTSLDAISQSFAASSEFQNTYGSLTNSQFVQLVYQNVLGRQGEGKGVVFWTKQLNSGARTRGKVMTGFSESNEYRTQQASEVDVSVLYILLLGRAPSAAEFADGVAFLDGPGTTADAAAQLLESTEYASLIT